MLDIAAYLWLRGHVCIGVKKLGPQYAEFSFVGADCAFDAETYMRGKAEGNLVAWMSARITLKRWCQFMPMPADQKHITAGGPRLAVATPGSPYWYLENNIVCHSMYGEREPHTSRFKAGNFYATSLDAVQARTLGARP